MSALACESERRLCKGKVRQVIGIYSNNVYDRLLSIPSRSTLSAKAVSPSTLFGYGAVAAGEAPEKLNLASPKDSVIPRDSPAPCYH